MTQEPNPFEAMWNAYAAEWWGILNEPPLGPPAKAPDAIEPLFAKAVTQGKLQ